MIPLLLFGYLTKTLDNFAHVLLNPNLPQLEFLAIIQGYYAFKADFLFLYFQGSDSWLEI